MCRLIFIYIQYLLKKTTFSCSEFKTKAFTSSTLFTRKSSAKSRRTETRCVYFMERAKTALTPYLDSVLTVHSAAKTVQFLQEIYTISYRVTY